MTQVLSKFSLSVCIRKDKTEARGLKGVVDAKTTVLPFLYLFKHFFVFCLFFASPYLDRSFFFFLRVVCGQEYVRFGLAYADLLVRISPRKALSFGIVNRYFSGCATVLALAFFFF